MIFDDSDASIERGAAKWGKIGGGGEGICVCKRNQNGREVRSGHVSLHEKSLNTFGWGASRKGIEIAIEWVGKLQMEKHEFSENWDRGKSDNLSQIRIGL